jgi:hypothetical protein
MRQGSLFRVNAGVTKLYVNQTVALASDGSFRIINLTQDPKNFTLYVQAEQPGRDDPYINLRASADAGFHGAVYAPGSIVSLTGGDYYGSFIGKRIFAGGVFWGNTPVKVHYDVSLGGASSGGSAGSSGSGSPVVLRSWKQL